MYPDFATGPPTEERVIELWTEYLNNTLIDVPLLDEVHLCGEGRMVSAQKDLEPSFFIEAGWAVRRTAAMSASRWWEIAVVGVNPSNPSPRGTSLFTLGREAGKTVNTDYGTELPIFVGEFCMQHAGSPPP